MRNPTFKAIEPNYRKRVVEITLQEGRKLSRYDLPFSAFKTIRVSAKNRFVSIDIDEELGRQGATFVMADGHAGRPASGLRALSLRSDVRLVAHQSAEAYASRQTRCIEVVRSRAGGRVEHVALAGRSAAGGEPRIQTTPATA